jgi:hypothetical protein
VREPPCPGRLADDDRVANRLTEQDRRFARQLGEIQVAYDEAVAMQAERDFVVVTGHPGFHDSESARATWHHESRLYEVGTT